MLAIVILLILIVADLVTARLAADSTRTYHELRQAIATQDTVVRLQLDEETGIRGYVATGDKLLLAPYLTARAHMASLLGVLHDQIAAFRDTPLDTGANRLAALNTLWEQTIARPSVNARRPSREAGLQVRGKPIIDAFRREAKRLSTALNARSDSLLDSLFAKLKEVSWISLALIVLVSVMAIAWLRHQNRIRAVYESAERQIESLQHFVDAFHRAQLPQALPSSPYVSFDATYVPAEEVSVIGGDWYDVFELDHQRYIFSMGDVTGHGLEAAIMMSRVRQTIVTLSTSERDPAVILERANAVLRRQGDQIVTALCGSIDAGDGSVILASAGHPPALVVGASGAIRELSSGAPPLGVANRLGIVSRNDRLLPGEMLVCYTDGVIENERNVIEGEALLRSVLASLKPDEQSSPAPAIRNRILGPRRGRDDVAILTITRSTAAVASQTSAA